MKALVLGASGMTGHMVSLYLKKQGHDILGICRRKVNYCNSIQSDVRNIELINKIIDENKFDVIINCVGVLNQFAEKNKDNAVFLNSYFPHLLAEITKDMKTQIIHISTDCVFSGNRGGYTESDFPDGKTFYDRSKALGELEDNKNMTIRTSIVGPDINSEGIGLLNWFMRQTNEVEGYKKVIWTGLTTLQLAKIIEVAVKEKVSGLYNMVYKEPITKHDLLKLFNSYLRKNEILIKPSDNPVIDKSLKRTRFGFGYIVPNYEIMISEMADWMKNNKELYPHYNI